MYDRIWRHTYFPLFTTWLWILITIDKAVAKQRNGNEHNSLYALSTDCAFRATRSVTDTRRILQKRECHITTTTTLFMWWSSMKLQAWWCWLPELRCIHTGVNHSKWKRYATQESSVIRKWNYRRQTLLAETEVWNYHNAVGRPHSIHLVEISLEPHLSASILHSFYPPSFLSCILCSVFPPWEQL